MPPVRAQQCTLLMGANGETSRILDVPDADRDEAKDEYSHSAGSSFSSSNPTSRQLNMPSVVADVVAKRYVLYPARWLLLAVCCLLALSNAMQWISYTTLTYQTEQFYCATNDSCGPALVTNQIFQFVAVVTGIGGMYVTDHYGIRLSIMSGVTLNLVGSIIRLFSSFPQIESHSLRLAMLHTGSVIVASAQAFFLVLPSKIAECWFSEDQRAISNVLTFIANPAGVALGTLAPGLFFPSNSSTFSPDSWDLFEFNSVMAGLTSLTFVLSLFVRRSLPPTSPSPSNERHGVEAPPFFASILVCLRNRQFIVQLFTFALGFAQLWGIMVIIPDILDANGYNLTGYPTAACALVGVATSLVAGAVADRTKRFKEIIQVCSVGFFLSAIFLRLYLMSPRTSTIDDVAVILATSLLGSFSIPQFPIGVEMGVETTFPVYEATSSGLLVLNGQLWMFVLYGVFEGAKHLNIIYHNYPPTSLNGVNVGNWKLVLDIWCVLAFVTALMTILFLRPIYKRVAFEEESRQQLERDPAALNGHPLTTREHKDHNDDL